MAKGELWERVMEEEMESLRKNETWDLLMLPNGRKPVGSKWVFKRKNEIRQVKKYKARLVAKGYSQLEGVDFDEILSLISNLASIGIPMFIVATLDFEIELINVKTTFLHGDLEEKNYMKQPGGFIIKGKKELV